MKFENNRSILIYFPNEKAKPLPQVIRNRHLKMNTICRYNIAFFIFIKNVLQIYIVFFLVGYSSSNSCRFFHASVYWPILYYLFVEIRLGSTCSISLKVFLFIYINLLILKSPTLVKRPLTLSNHQISHSLVHVNANL